MQHSRSLESRIEALESRCHRLRLWCLASTAGLLGACLTSATSSPPKVLRAEQFLLVAPDSRTAGAWSADEKGAQLSMAAANGACSLLLAAGEGEVHEGKRIFRLDGSLEDGGIADALAESDFQVERTWQMPFAGLTVSSAAQGEQPWTLVHVGTGARPGTPGFQVERGGTSACLQLWDAGALLNMVGGDATFGALNASASESGAVVDVSWNDELAANIAATPATTGLSIHTDPDDDAEEDDPPPAIEVIADEQRSPVVRIRDGGRVVFEAP